MNLTKDEVYVIKAVIENCIEGVDHDEGCISIDNRMCSCGYTKFMTVVEKCMDILNKKDNSNSSGVDLDNNLLGLIYPDNRVRIIGLNPSHTGNDNNYIEVIDANYGRSIDIVILTGLNEKLKESILGYRKNKGH